MNVNYPSGGIASLLSAQGRDGDSMLVHMSPNEVRGLQNLAMAAGGSLSINPETGLYEASFLKKLLPTIIGAVLTPLTGGLINPLTAGAIVGGVEGIRTGDLGKGLMAGLGAYGGAGLASGLAGMGSLAAKTSTEALKQTLANEAPGQLLKTAGEQAAKEGLRSYGSNILGGLKSIGDVGIGATAKGLGSTLGATGVMGLGSNVMSAMTPDMQMPKGTDEDNLYYISEGYDPEKGFLGGQYVKKYPGLPTGYSEGGDVAKEAPKQDLKAYYQSLLAPQQAPQQNAALQQYMSDMNRFVTAFGPNAPKTSPTYVAPPPPPEVRKPDDTRPPPPPVKPPGTPTGPFDPNDPNSWMSTIDPDILRQIQDGTFNPFAGAAGRFGGDFGAGRETRAAQQGAGTQQQDVYDPTSFQYDPFVDGYSGGANAGMFGGRRSEMDFAGGTPGFDMGDTVIPPTTPTTPPASTMPDYGMQDYMRDYGGRDFSGGTPGFDMGDTPVMPPSPAMPDYGINPDNFGDFNFGGMYAGGGQLGSYSDGGRMLRGPGDGMSDSIPAEIRGRRGRQPARLADGEFVVPADVVSHLGNGSTEAGSRKLYKMMDNIRRARTGKTRQAPQVKAEKYLPRKK
jgi:hypothetical protein